MQMAIAIIAAAIILIAAIWLFLIFPNPRRSRARAWQGTKFAHRGLHSGDCVENSLECSIILTNSRLQFYLHEQVYSNFLLHKSYITRKNKLKLPSDQIRSDQSLSRVQLFATP